jgi:DNA-binding CsgD family transcriptional regulator
LTEVEYAFLAQKHFLIEKDDDVAAIFYKDLEHRYQYVNDNLLTIMKYYAPDNFNLNDVIGKHDVDLYPLETANYFIKLDLKVISTMKPIKLFEVFQISHNKVIHAVVTKLPIFDHDNNIKGILGKTRFLNYFKLYETPVILSKRELDILAHIVFGMSIKKTAQNLQISLGTVSTYLNRVKNKLRCRTQSDLVRLIRKHTLSDHVLEYLCRIEDNQYAFDSEEYSSCLK